MKTVDISRLLGVTAELTLNSRIIIKKLLAAHRNEVHRGQVGSYLYNVNRQINLHVALKGYGIDTTNATYFEQVMSCIRF